MAGGYKSLLASWIGGASANPAAVSNGGVRSLLAPWIGGASAPAGGSVTAGGRRAFLAFWMGGAATGIVVPPVRTETPSGGWEYGGKRPWHPWLDFPRLAAVVKKDEELADAVIAAVAEVADDRHALAVRIARAEQALRARLAAQQQVWKQTYLELIRLEYERREQEYEDAQIVMLLFDI